MDAFEKDYGLFSGWFSKPRSKDRGVKIQTVNEINDMLLRLSCEEWGFVMDMIAESFIPYQLESAIKSLKRCILKVEDLYLISKTGTRVSNIMVISPYDLYGEVTSLQTAFKSDLEIQGRFNCEMEIGLGFPSTPKGWKTMVDFSLTDEEKTVLEENVWTQLEAPKWFKVKCKEAPMWFKVSESFYGAMKQIDNYLQHQRRLKEFQVGDLYFKGKETVRINAIDTVPSGKRIIYFNDNIIKMSIQSVRKKYSRQLPEDEFRANYDKLKKKQATPPAKQKIFKVEHGQLYSDGKFVFDVKNDEDEDGTMAYFLHPRWNDEDETDLKLGYAICCLKNFPIRVKTIKKISLNSVYGFQKVQSDCKRPTFNDENVKCFLKRYEEYQLPVAENYWYEGKWNEVEEGIRESLTKNLKWLKEFRQTMKRYGGSKTADKIAFSLFIKKFDVATYHTFTEPPSKKQKRSVTTTEPLTVLEDDNKLTATLLKEIEDHEFYAELNNEEDPYPEFDTWSCNKTAMAAKKHARDIRKLFPRTPAATVANESTRLLLNVVQEVEAAPAPVKTILKAGSKYKHVQRLREALNTDAHKPRVTWWDNWTATLAEESPTPTGEFYALYPNTGVIDLTNDTDSETDSECDSDDSVPFNQSNQQLKRKREESNSFKATKIQRVQS